MPTAMDLLGAKVRGGVLTTTPEATVQDACRLMRQERVGCLVVTTGKAVAGIFTERDVINRVVAEARDPAATIVGDVMTREVIVVKPDRSIEEIEAIMKQQRIRHLPVVGERELAGLLSIGDVAAWHADKDKQLVEYLQDYMHGWH
ncbi:MAG: CBS domain-containing protein [Phycisphaerales bacterium]|nr:CBS domain-containing protein [Phycisphaerales bacterium]